MASENIKWIPACGPRLIINSGSKESVGPLYSNENEELLPKFSKKCSEMSTKDFYPRMNIYTQFGDLSASQILSLFSQFRNWPEYGESSFLASLENSLLKMEASADESIDGIGLAEEDDVSADLETLIEPEEGETTATAGVKRKKKVKVVV